MTIIWTSDYELGIDVIDNQHKRIVEYINQLYDLEHQQGSADTLEDVLYNLVDYTYSHFEFEEALMQEAGYEDADAHAVTHRTFTQQIETLRKRFEDGDDVATELANMLQRWLLKHILSEDVGYLDAVKKDIQEKTADQHQSWAAKAVKKYFKGH